MPAFTSPSESDDPGPETRLDVAASTVDHPDTSTFSPSIPPSLLPPSPLVLSIVTFPFLRIALFTPLAYLHPAGLASYGAISSCFVLAERWGQTLEARLPQSFHSAMSQVRLSVPVDTRFSGADAT
ncbi:hypothetical protein B0H14DRAFT_3496175 [Mycena olivaceomarginata]|nr:hypothetical protein B0H14DRAFT_3496175 [Mycena olivaceomarginata]